MNDEFERLILTNRNAFQEEEPEYGHFERFEARLQKKTAPGQSINFRPVLKIAAMLVFALMAINQARIYFYPEKHEALSLGSISEEYREVEFFYTNSIQLGMNQWEKLKNEGLISVEEQDMMQKEQEDFDLIYQKLVEDLKANPGDERVINAMLEFYQSRMNVITLIINKLKDAKQQKNQKYEIKI